VIRTADIEKIPHGRWAIGVSGGADSVALLLLLHERPEISLHVVHLDHQTRGEESTADAEFVRELAGKLKLPATIARRDQIEPEMNALPKNRSARFRAIRLELFRRVVEREKLDGVVLAHHADDQAETIVLRLLRGSGPTGLGGMKPRQQIGGMCIMRPLLSVRRQQLREYLVQIGQTCREDASNQSDRYARNRLRRFLESRPDLHEPIISMGRACAEYLRWIRQAAARLDENFPAIALERLPRMVGRESARQWLKRQGVPAGELSADVLDRLRRMSIDAATPAHQAFPGNIKIHRRRGWISRA